jgi:hypothetical protein
MTTQTDSNTTTADVAAPTTTANAGELITFVGATFSLPIIPAPLVVTFNGSDGTRTQLTVNKGIVTFDGNPDAAAEMFIEAVTRLHAQQWGTLLAQLEKTEAQLAAYSHHNGLMMIAQRLVDAERERDALRDEVNRTESR